jgi:hypothetical protein
LLCIACPLSAAAAKNMLHCSHLQHALVQPKQPEVRLGVRGVGRRALQRGVQNHGAVQHLHPARPQQRAVPRSVWRNELQPAPLKSAKRGCHGEVREKGL